jgi:hypothetical protein
MSDSDTTITDARREVDPPTQEIFVSPTDNGGAVPPSTPVPAFDDDGGDDEWPDRGPRKGVRMSVPTVVLLALLVAAGGIWGGAALQRSHGTTSGTAGGASALASLFRNRASATGGGFAGSALAGATTGTVTEVSGSTLYVTNASGALVKVTVAPSVTVDRNASSTLASLQVGDTVIVQGTKAANGSVTASSVAATAAGVTSTFGGFGARGAAG